MEKKATKISIFQVIIFVVCFGLAYFAANFFFSENNDSVNKMLIENSQKYNREMPRMLDAITRLDSTSVEGETLKYHHTLIDVVKDSSDLDFDLIKNTMSRKAQDNLDTNPVMKDYRENDVYLQFIFVDKNNDEIFDFTVKTKKNK